MYRGLLSLLAVFFLGRLAAADAPDASRVRVAPRPEWVQAQPDPDYAAQPSEGATRGIYYLLIEHQVEVEKQEAYSRVAYKITSAAGVQGASQVAFSFDPEYQSIDLHSLIIWRDGQRQDRLNLSKMQVLQQERDLERHQYNGQLTALFLLEDVRAGDEVEYSYTRRGENPIFGRHYMDTIGTRWSSPIHRQSIRLLVGRDRSLTYQQLGGSPLTLAVKSQGERVEYLWQAQDQTAAEFEAGTPLWYLPFSLLQVTDFKSWKEVAEWAQPLYAPTPLSEALGAKLKELTAGCSTDGQRVAAVLEFVQNDIRYLGIELGARSHAPSAADRVFQLRYGDCKDKVRLFCTLLHELDISAVPALTHSGRGKKLNDYLPSIEAFDHVIARVDLADRSYWVDPTLTDQAGTLGNHALPNYEWALPIEPGSHALQRVDNARARLQTSLDLKPQKSLQLRAIPSLTFEKTDQRWLGPPQGNAGDVDDQRRGTEVRVSESYSVGQPGGPAELEVKSVFCGLAADNMRGVLRETPPDQLGKHLLNLRAKFFPNLKLVGNPTWSDDRKRNEVTLEHRYQLPQFWRKEEKSPVLVAEVYPLILRDYLAAPETMVRTAPYAVQFPLRVICEIDLNFQKPWPTKPETRTIQDPAFEGRYSAAQYGNQVSLKYEFTTLKDAVEATRMEEYATHLHDFRDTFGMTLTFDPEIAKRNATFRQNGRLLAVGAISLAVWIALALWVYRRPWRLHAPSHEPDSEYVGIGGWLILVAFGVVVRPLHQVAVISRDYEKYLDLRVWEAVTANSQMALSMELVGQLGLGVLTVLTAIVFFQRRPLFPVLFVATFGALLVFQGLDGLIVSNLIGWNNKQTTEMIAGLMQVILPGCVWIPYMFMSRRVKATFTLGNRIPNTPAEPPPLVAVERAPENGGSHP